MTIFWEPDEQVVDNVRPSLGGKVTVVDAAPSAARSVIGDAEVSLLVIGSSADLASALRVADEVRTERPEVGVVLVRRRLDVALLSEASRAGVREVVGAEDLGALADACRRSRQLSARLGAGGGEVSDGRVVTVFSAKGGSGKTTVATNVAVALAPRDRVLLVDLDLAFGDVAIALGMSPDRTIVDLVPLLGRIDADGLGSAVSRHESGADVLAACKVPSDADLVPAALVGELLRVARRTYDVIVVDTPPAFTEHVLAAFDAADLTLVVGTLDIPSVKNLRLALETMDLLGLPDDLRRVVLNRADAGNGLTVDDVAATLHCDVDARIPESKEIGVAVNRGVPVVLHAPRSGASVALRALATNQVMSRTDDTTRARAGRRTRATAKRAAERSARSPFRRRALVVEAGA